MDTSISGLRKTLTIHPNVAKHLDELKSDYMAEHEKEISYSDIIKELLIETERWTESTNRLSEKRSKKKKSKKHLHDDDEE